MKICSSCNAKYSDWIDFCFEDGAVLALERQAQPTNEAIDAPMPRHLRAQEAQDTPQPKTGGRRRSLIGGAARENSGSPMDVPTPVVAASILDVPPPPPTEPAVETKVPSAWTGADIAARHAGPPAQQPEPLRPVEIAPPQPKARPAPAPPAAPPAAPPVAQAPAPAPPPPAPAAPVQAAAPTPEPAGFTTPPSVDFEDEVDEKPAARPLWLIPVVGVVGLLVVGGIGALVVVGLGVGGLTLSGGGKDAARVPSTTRPVAAVPVVPPSASPDAPAEVVPPEATDAVAAVEPSEAVPVVDPVVDPVVAAEPVRPQVPPPSEVRPAVPVAAVPAPIVQPPVEVPVGVVAAQFPVTVEGTPPGATVMVNGENKGQTPVTLQLSSGDYKLEVSKGGFSAEKRSVAVRAAAQTVKYELWEETRVGKVFVAFSGRDGQTLLVDGLPMGTLPASVDLTEGTHTFAVANGDGTLYSVSKDVVFNAAGRATVTQ